jgi:RNA polymerase sigma factor (sigma-70 family)
VDPDLPLIQALQAGDESALNELIQRHREPLFRFAFRFLRDETAARDIVQETFVRIYFKAARFVPRSTAKTWFYAIALNLCRDQARFLKRRRGDVSLDAPVTEARPKLEPADSGPVPSEQAAEADRFGRLQHAMDRLPHKLKSALVLCSLEGMSHQEAAEILATTPKTIELRIYHAKEKMRVLLSGEFSRDERRRA